MKFSRWPALWFALLVCTPPFVASNYLASQISAVPFPPFALFERLVHILPGSWLTLGIEVMVSGLTAAGLSISRMGKIVEQTMALSLYALLLLGGTIVWNMSLRADYGRWRGLLLGVVTGLPTSALFVLMGRDWLGAVWTLEGLIVWGLLVNQAYERLVLPKPFSSTDAVELSIDYDRRRFIILWGGTAAAITIAGTGLGRVVRRRRDVVAQSGSDSMSPTLATRSVEPAPGTRPEYTQPEEHYYIDLNMLPPFIDGETWTLTIGGLIKRELTVTINDFYEERLGEPWSEIITLSCISNRVGGDLIGTTRWTGIPLRRLLRRAEIVPQGRYVRVASADNYYEVLPLDLVMNDERVMLTYLWDGEPLNVGHGYPLRLFVPGFYGMKQPKWITSIEIMEKSDPGFWGQRGWNPAAEVKATAVIDTVAVESMYEKNSQQIVPIGGIAYAGDRGISSVEVQVDGGQWRSARLREPLSPLTWVVWRYDWPFEAGEHTFAVRCWDGTGALQIVEQNPPHPSGATGIHIIATSL